MAALPKQLVQHIRRLASAATPSPDADALLLAHFVQHRNEEAFAALVQRHGPMVLGVCRRILGNVQDAEDAFQAAFLVLARKADSVQPREALTAWLYGVARRIALKAAATNSRRTRELRRLTPTVEPQLSPLDDLSSRELLAIFDEELQRLPRTYRLPLILCCLEGRTQEEAARQLGWTAGSVKGRLERGRARLQTRLRRRGLLLSAALMVVEAARGRVSAALGTATVKESLSFAAGRGSEGVAQSLAELVCRGMAWTRGIVWAGLLSAAFVAATTTLGWHTLADKPAELQQPNAAPAELSRQPEIRNDRHGDPLPAGAIARLGTMRFRGVRGCLAFSPDGKRLVTETRSGGSVAIWDTATGRKVREIAGTATLIRLAFSADGRRLALSDNAKSCRIVDAESGKELFELSGTNGVFSADGKVVVTCQAGDPSVVRSWNALTGRPLLAKKFSLFIPRFAMAGDGRTLAVINQTLGEVDRKGPAVVDVLDLVTGTVIRSFPLVQGGWPQLTLTADGKTLASADFDTVRLWNRTTGKMLAVWECRNLSGAAVFSPDGKRLAWTSLDEKGGSHRLWVVEREGGKPRTVGTPVNNFETPCFAPDGKRLAVVTDAGILSLRDVADGKEVVSFEAHNRPISDLAFSADGQQVVSRADNDLFVWQTQNGKLLRRLPFLLPDHEFVGSLLPDGFLLSRESTTDPATRGRFWLRDMRTGEAVSHFDGTPVIRLAEVVGPAAVATPDHRYIALRGRSGELCLMDARNRRCLYRIPDNTEGAKLSTDGEVFVWCSQLIKGFEIHVRRRSSDKLLSLNDLPKGDYWRRIFASQPCLAPDGRWLVLATDEGRLRRWDLTTGKEATPLMEALRTPSAFCWSADSRFLAVQGSAFPPNGINNAIGARTEQDLRVWDAATGARLRHLTLPDKGGLRFLFSPDGRTLLTTDSQGVLHFWEVATGKERGQLHGHLSGIGALTFRADGRLLVSGGYDSQGFVWDVTGRMPDGQWRQPHLSPEQRRAAWESLASSDAKAAYRAIWQLSADPEGSIAFLREQVRPIARPKPGQVKRAIAALDSAEFAERERAAEELENFGETISVDLRRTLSQKPSLEMRRRIEALLEKLEGVPYGRQLQALRALEVLEHIDTLEARTVLRTLADGAAGARLTEEARRTLRRAQANKTP